jgi:nicotinate-nucleotide pyrophosphorylase (carboxylating)
MPAAFPGLPQLREIARRALEEDLGVLPGGSLEGRDITTIGIVPAALRARARILAREPLVAAGGPVAREVFLALDPNASWSAVPEGDALDAGDTVATVEGSARAILTGERSALNFLQRLCGIATMARRAAEEVRGTRAVVLDTRKTTPLLRSLEKYAVAVGGGVNHRAGLYDAILVKDNHVAIAGGVGAAIARLREAGHDPAEITVEVDDFTGLDEALAAGAGRILLDNFGPDEARRAIARIAGRAKAECSGGLAAGGLRPFAEAGADFLSLGCLTHSVRASDLSLEMEPLP